MTLGQNKPFMKKPILALLVRFLIWFFLCCVTIFFYYWAFGKLSVEISSKIIKIASLLGIFIQLLEWLSKTKNDADDLKDQLRWAKTVYWITLGVMVVLFTFVAHDAFKEFYGIPPRIVSIHTVRGKLAEISLVLGISAVSVAPIAALFWANWKLSSTSGAEDATKFLYFVNFPCLAASLAVFVLVGIGVIAMPVEDLKNFLSGAMAFLVFVAFITEATIASGVDREDNT
jgi:hypothetical protein